jgi:hypothetical protein
MSDYNIEKQILYLLDKSKKDYQKYIYGKYLNTEDIPLYMREFYSESSSWFTNTDIDSMNNTIYWSTMNNDQKNKLLDNELDEYFN